VYSWLLKFQLVADYTVTRVLYRGGVSFFQGVRMAQGASSGENIFYHLPVNIGEPDIPASKMVGEFFMVNAQ